MRIPDPARREPGPGQHSHPRRPRASAGRSATESHFFASADAAAPWLAEHREASVVPVEGRSSSAARWSRRWPPVPATAAERSCPPKGRMTQDEAQLADRGRGAAWTAVRDCGEEDRRAGGRDAAGQGPGAGVTRSALWADAVVVPAVPVAAAHHEPATCGRWAGYGRRDVSDRRRVDDPRAAFQRT